MSETIKVGMADYKIGSEGDTLVTLGLGSCIGVIIYDTGRKIAGLAHIMLLSSREIKNNANKLKFADSCIDLMMEDLLKRRVSRSALKAKIAGGAQMFSVSLNSDAMNVGRRNALAVKEKLKSLGIPIVAEDIYGNWGRTIRFNCSNFELSIKSIGRGESII